jgi:hypothetical protein
MSTTTQSTSENELYNVIKPSLEAVDTNVQGVFASQTHLKAQLDHLEKGTSGVNGFSSQLSIGQSHCSFLPQSWLTSSR